MNWDDEHPSYKSELGRRIGQAVAGVTSKKEVAERAGISVEQLNKWMGSDPPKVPTSGLLAISEVTGVDFYWLATGGSPKSSASSARQSDFPSVPRFDVALSAGHGSFVDRAEQLDMIPFTAEFFARRLGRGPNGLVIVDARGDSMEPTISDRDLVMIDTTDTQLTPAIWAFTLDDAVLVKRLSPTAGGLEIVSDNQLYGRQLLDSAQAAQVHLIGRVVWVGRVL